MRSVTPRPRRPTCARLAFEKKCSHQHIPTLRNRNAIWRWSITPAAIIQKQPSFTAHRSRVGKKQPISRQRITKSWLQITRTCSVRWAKPAKRSSWKRGRANGGADKFRARLHLVISACAREMAAQFNRPNFSSSRGGIGRRVRLRTVWGNPWRFESSREQVVDFSHRRLECAPWYFSFSERSNCGSCGFRKQSRPYRSQSLSRYLSSNTH